MSSSNRSPSLIIEYGLYSYFLALSFRNISKSIIIFPFSKDKSPVCPELDSKLQTKCYSRKRKLLNMS